MITFSISGFDSSKVVDSQKVKVTVTSAKYSGKVSVTIKVKILPECIVSAEVVDAETYLKECFILNESLDYANLKIENTYSNGKKEIVIAIMINIFELVKWILFAAIKMESPKSEPGMQEGIWINTS